MTMASSVRDDVVRYDLSDPTLLFREDVIDDPVPLYEQLRREAPVWEIPGTQTFLVTRADLVTEAVGRTEDFSSNLTSLIYRGDDGQPCVWDMASHGDGTHVLATADPPVHTVHRKLFQPRLTPARVGELRGSIADAVDELLTPIISRGHGDVVAELVDPLPIRVIANVIGLPADSGIDLVQLVLDTDEILAGVSSPAQMQQAAASALEMGQFLGAQLYREIERGEPSDTLLGVLAAAVGRGEVTFDEAAGILVQLLSAGSETTSSLIGSAIQMLAADDAWQSRLRSEPARIPDYIEEVLRLQSPFRFHYRSARRSSRLGGVEIPAGSRVLLMWGAANRDESYVDHPDELDIDRPVLRSHFAFGRGIHFCIGAPLARLEAHVAIERLLARTSRVQLDVDRPARLRRNIFLRRFAQLGVIVS